MTRKDYVILASILHVAHQHLPFERCSEMLDHACNLLKKDNPSFDRQRFVAEVTLPRTFVKDVLRGKHEP